MNWWGRLWRRTELETELEREMRFHLEQHSEDLMASGLSAREAQRQALLALGGAEQWKEECRDARGTRWLEEFAQDLRYGVRSLWQKPGFAAITLLTLALGIGATTLMFTVIQGVLLKPVPYAEPHRLLRLREHTDRATRWGNVWSFSYPNFVDCRRDNHTLQMAAWRNGSGVVSQPGPAEYVDGVQVSYDLFSILGVQLDRGRAFLPTEERIGSGRVAIISYRLWQSRFHGEATTLGKTLVFEGMPYTVVGIAPPGFRLLGYEQDVFTVLGQNPNPLLQDRDRHPGIQVLARLRPSVTEAAARADLAVIAGRLAAQYPKSNAERSFFAFPLRIEVGDDQSTLWLLLGAVGLVLLIACVNAASLLLARAVSREREFAMRLALGASRGRLVRQSLTESGLLGVLGGLLGMALAAFGLHPFLNSWPGSLPGAERVQFDGVSLLFSFALSIGSGLLFGLTPALRIPVSGIEQTLRAGGRTVAGSARRLHKVFVVSEIALALVLLGCAGMLGRTLFRLSSVDTGVQVKDVLTARVALASDALARTANARAAWDSVLAHARTVPGVRAAALVDTVPMREGNNEIGYWLTPAEPPQEQQKLVSATTVTPDYFALMGLALHEGRFLNDGDRLGAESAVVIDEVMAREAFGRESPIGKHVWIGMGSDPARVVGVVGHVRYWGPANDDQAKVRAELYLPLAQVPDTLMRRWSEILSLAVRTEGAPGQVSQRLRSGLRGSLGNPVLYEERSMEQIANGMLGRQRFLLFLFVVFAGISLVLASIGVFGVLAYLTSQRIGEFGLRMALGSTPGGVVQLVLRETLTLVFAGIGIGVAGAFAAGRVLLRLVEGMRAAEAWTFALMIPVLMAAALLAAFLPARRASLVDPMNALRQD